MTAKRPANRPGWATAVAEARIGEAWAAASLQSAETWDEAVEAVLSTLDLPGPPDLALVFIDARFAANYSAILDRLVAATGTRHLIGCAGQGVIGTGVESERQPAISVLALSLPGAVLTPVPVDPGHRMERDLQMSSTLDIQSWLVFTDPYSIDSIQLVEMLEEQWPGRAILGGQSSAHNAMRGTALFLDGVVYPAGAVLMGLGGSVRLRSVVAQGAEPIGLPWTITDCEGNVVRSIGFRPAMEVLVETMQELDPELRNRARQNLLVGLAIDEYRDEFGRGDFLIRNLIGADRQTGSIGINAFLRVGQTIQFQLRDAAAADEDLQARLREFRSRLDTTQRVLGAVLCTCNGRGMNLFNVQHHDAQALEDALGAVPTAGLFCNGEIGPVGGRTFLHGFTASIGLIVLDDAGR